MSETLPALQTAIDAELIKQDKETNQYLVKLQGFCNLLNKDVAENKLEPHPVAKDSLYLPISFVEMALDRLYFGLWSTENYRWQLHVNEIVAALDLKVYHPIAKVWITRTGVAAKKIMTDAIPEEMKREMTKTDFNRWSLNLDNKKPSALEMGGFAALKALALKNAALSLGKYLGRDVNREHVDEDTKGIVKPIDVTIKEYRQKVADLLTGVQDTEMKQDIIDEILTAEGNGMNTIAFYNSIIAKLEKNG